jgi:hypothetical protein
MELVFDISDRPAAGTECFDCRKLGHFCPAKGMRGEYALCVACGNGESCDQAKSIEKMHAGLGGFEEFEAENAPAECRTIEIPEADRVVAEASAPSDWAMKASLDPENLRKGLKRSDRAPLAPNASGVRTGPRRVAKVKVVKERKPQRVARVRQVKPVEAVMEKMELEAAKAKAIEMFGAGDKIGKISKETGWSWERVQHWLRVDGLLPAGEQKAGKKKAKPALEKKGRFATPPVAERPVSVGIQLTERSLDAFWAKCSLADKARAFSAMFEAR